MIFLILTHMILWFFIIWSVRVAMNMLFILTKSSNQIKGSLLGGAVIMGLLSLLLHVCLYKIGLVPITFN